MPRAAALLALELPVVMETVLLSGSGVSCRAERGGARGTEGGVRIAVRVRPGGGGGVLADAVEQGGGLGAAALAGLGVGEEVEVDQAAWVALVLPLQPPVEGGLHHLPGPASAPVAGGGGVGGLVPGGGQHAVALGVGDDRQDGEGGVGGGVQG